jgi:hypothetical protein
MASDQQDHNMAAVRSSADRSALATAELNETAQESEYERQQAGR